MSENNLNAHTSGGSPQWTNTPSGQSAAPTTAPVPAPGTVAGNGTAVPGTPVTLPEDVLGKDQLLSDSKTQSLMTFGNAVIRVFSTNPSHPTLTPSTVNDPSVAFQALATLYSPDTWNSVMQNADTAPEGSTADENVDNAQQIVVTDPQILQVAQKQGVPPAQLYTNVQTETNNSVEQQLSQLPPEDADQLRFAYYIPSGSKNLSPSLKAQLQKIVQTANQQIAQKLGLQDWQGLPVDAKEFTQTLTAQYDTAFKNNLQTAVNDGTMTQEQANAVTALHYEATPATKASPILQQLLKQITQQTLSPLQLQYGFNDSWTPSPDIAFYNNVANGDFSQSFQKAVKGYTGNITDAQKALLAKYYANPNDPSIPKEIKQLAQSIATAQKQIVHYFENPNDPNDADGNPIPANVIQDAKSMIAQVTSAIVAKYDLDTSWTPTITTLTPPGVNQAGLNLANGAVSTLKEMHSSAQQIVNDMPNSPEKGQYLNFLKAIGVALDQLQNTIYAMQASQSSTAQTTSNLQLSMQLDNLDHQQQAADQAQHDSGKMSGMGPLDDIMSWTTKIAIIAVGAMFGPVTLALAIAYVVDTSKNGKNSLTDQMFSAIQSGCQSLCNQMGLPSQCGQMLGIAVNLTVSSILSMGNPLLLINLVCQDSKAIQNFVAMCGGNQEAQDITAMVCMQVAQIAMMVALCFVTGGAASEGLAATIADMIVQATNISVKAAKITVIVLQYASAIIMSALQITASGIQLNNNILLAEIDMIKAHAEAYSEEIEAVVGILQGLVKKLLDGLQGNSSWITNISTQQGQKWSNASNLSSEIFG